MFKIYLDTQTGMCVINGTDYSPGGFSMRLSADNRLTMEKDGRRVVMSEPFNTICTANGTPYPDYATFRAAIKGFFVKASSESSGEAGNVNGGDAFSTYN